VFLSLPSGVPSGEAGPIYSIDSTSEGIGGDMYVRMSLRLLVYYADDSQ
jgi:hypothetical protein